jgi:putative ABC transport system permease protein
MVGGRHRFRDALVVLEIGGSLMLLIVAGLFARSLGNAQRTDLGFDPHGVINLTIDPHEVGYNKEQGLAFDKRLLETVRALPGVQSASLAQVVPMSYFGSNDYVQVPGYQILPGEAPPLVWDDIVSTGYLQTMRIPIVEGRDFTDADNETSQPVAIVNQAMVAWFWPHEDPIGKEFLYGSSAPARVRIVGVAKDSRVRSMIGPVEANFYAPMAQAYLSLATLQVRAAGPTETIAREVQDAVQTLAPGMPLFGVQTMMQALESIHGLLVFQFGALLAATLGSLGLILAMVGLYGVISYAASQRVHEIGIRMALGAQPSHILRMMLRQGSVVVVIGISAGLLAALAATRAVRGYLVGVTATDPLTYAGASLLLTLIALAACYVPTRRAMRVDPMAALRHE